jgi:hypothetical protein
MVQVEIGEIGHGYKKKRVLVVGLRLCVVHLLVKALTPSSETPWQFCKFKVRSCEAYLVSSTFPIVINPALLTRVRPRQSVVSLVNPSNNSKTSLVHPFGLYVSYANVYSYLSALKDPDQIHLFDPNKAFPVHAILSWKMGVNNP